MPIKDNMDAYRIVGLAMRVHAVLGCGFLEAVYADALEIELKKTAIPYEREKQIDIKYEGVLLNSSYRADFVCFGSIIIELKAIKQIGAPEFAQIFNYLKATSLPYALLLNFGEQHFHYEYIDPKFTNYKQAKR